MKLASAIQQYHLAPWYRLQGRQVECKGFKRAHQAPRRMRAWWTQPAACGMSQRQAEAGLLGGVKGWGA